MSKVLHCVTVVLEHGEDSYERVKFFAKGSLAAMAAEGSKLMGLPSYRRTVQVGELLFQAKVSDGDRTERDGLTKETLLEFAATMKIPSISRWVEKHAVMIDRGEIPPELQDAPRGWNYCNVCGYKAEMEGER
jgi:hypothetical protein